MGNPTIDPGKKARGSNQEPLRQEETEAASNHRHSPVNAGWTEVPAPPGSLSDAQEHLPPPLLQPSPCCSSGGEQETSSISITQRFPPGHQGGKKKEDADEAPARKRANLDHLSPEERMLRRKLKNRVAAQTARDKKKAATDSMEKQLAEAQARLQDSLDANAQLLKTNTQLQMENANLQQQNSELQARLSPLCPLPPSPPASPLPSPSATSPHTPLSTVLSPPETADLTCVPQQQEQGKSTMPQASSNPGLSSK